MYAEYRDEVEFYVVYIREAHPDDGWQMQANVREGVIVDQPTTVQGRAQVATHMCQQLELSIPTVIDGLDDAVNQAYSGWPDRLYLIGKDGKIVYKGGPGPGGFKAAELEAAIILYLAQNSGSTGSR